MKSAIAILALSTFVSASFKPASDHRLQITSRSFGNVTDEIATEDYDKYVVYDDSEDGWTDIGFGAMMLDNSVPDQNALAKRDNNGRRDWGSIDTALEFDERSGEFKFPRSWEEAKSTVTKISKRATSWSAKLTWYTGHDLLNPSCCDRSGFTPSDHSMVAAVTEIWSAKPACGSYVVIRPKGSKKAIYVRVVDTCGGCPPQVAHFDLTKAAFSKLMSLDIGVATGAEVKIVKSPVKTYTKAVIAAYGPKNL